MNEVIQVWGNHLPSPKVPMSHNNEKTKGGSFWLEHVEGRKEVLRGSRGEREGPEARGSQRT